MIFMVLAPLNILQSVRFCKRLSLFSRSRYPPLPCGVASLAAIPDRNTGASESAAVTGRVPRTLDWPGSFQPLRGQFHGRPGYLWHEVTTGPVSFIPLLQFLN